MSSWDVVPRRLLRRSLRPLKRLFLRERVPSLLWHYTSSEVFQKIIRSQCLWATDVSKSNDPNELKIATEEIHAALREYKECQGIASGDGWLGAIADDRTHFAVCLSSHEDVLSQWRGYADMCSGVALGFDTYELRRIAFETTWASSIDLYEVLYCKERFGYTLRNYIEDWIKATKKDGYPAPNLSMYLDLRYRGMCLKHEFWSEEAEWRIGFHLGMNEKRYRDEHFFIRNSERVRYRPVAISDQKASSLRCVVLAPNCTLSKAQVESALTEVGLGDVVVKLSRGQYR